MEAKAIWKGKMAFDGVSGRSRMTLPLDTSIESGGDDNGFRPMELILIGLAGCTAMDVVSILEKKRQKLTAMEVRVMGERAEEHPRTFTHIVTEYIVTGNELDRTAVERAVELSETKYCSVGGMLKEVAKMESKITILEAQAE